MPRDARAPAAPIGVAVAGGVRARDSYLEILKSSALIGGSTLLSLAIGVVRTKAMSVLLGPTGFGLFGIYNSIADLSRSVAEMGVNASGVRQIAAAASSGDEARIARTVTVVRRVALVLAALGGVGLLAFSGLIAEFTFGNNAQTGAVALLSLVLAFRLIADAQGALIQGMRRVGDFARMGVIAALAGTIITIPLVYFFGQDGILPAMIAGAAMAIATSWWYARKVRIASARMTVREIAHEARGLLKLGVAFMASGFLMMASAYAVRMIVLRQGGLEATGFYQSAWTIGGLYVGFVLQAMGTDFYPRLVGVVRDDRECNRIVNEQAHVSLLLAGPGVLGTLACAPLVIHLLYSPAFLAAVDVLRWIALGMALRVVTWPMGFIIVARGEQVLFLLTEVAWTIVSIGLAFVLVGRFGLVGAGMAFFASYVFHGFMLYPIVRRLSGFRWSSGNRRTGVLFLLSLAIAFAALVLLPAPWGTALAVTAALASSAYSFNALLLLVPEANLPRYLRAPAAWLRRRRGRTA